MRVSTSPPIPRPATAALLLLAVLAACSAPRRSPMVGHGAVRLDLPVVRQDELHECGLAAVSALCQYYGVEIPATTRAQLAARAGEAEGLSGAELRAALEPLGMEVFIFPGTLDRSTTGLYGQVDRDRAAIVMHSKDGRVHHYSLVLGYDEPRGTILLLDPQKGPVARERHAFLRDWERSRRFVLLAVPRREPTLPGEAASPAARSPEAAVQPVARPLERPPGK